ncbi:hypothetical protein [Kitasatospora paracochleata]|uniref:WD40 repeat domain-containing protein n=1 Tax=Kitasatospora paracochleata TaxID=58354 RepID=A0ABT1J2B9_9ACTN|nr:hypothetical protein [Kitasatospora paracochleata]MCP2311573.1 hypothetical protein [Kitasatospora paracochleata]
MRAEMVTKVEIAQPGPSRLENGRGWYRQVQGVLEILDPEFDPVRQYDLGEHISSFAVSPDLSRVVVGGKDHIRLVDEHGNVLWSVQHAPWGTGYSYSGSCEFSADGKTIWATVPETELDSDEEDGLWEDDEVAAASSGGWSAPEGWGDQWWVMDATSGRIIGRKWLGCEATGSATLRHPDQVHMGLSVGEGQDGSRIYWGSLDEGSLHVATTGDVSRALADVHPDGSAYLTLPRDSDGLTIHDFSSRAVIAHRPNREFLESGEWPLHARYLDGETVLLETVDGKWNCARHLVFDARSLEYLGEVTYPTGISCAAFHSVHAGTWATGDASGLYQWRLDV